MSPFESLTELITCRFHKKIKKACAPLFDYFNLSDFWYYRITNSGHTTYLASHDTWSEFFAEEKFYLNFPLLRHPQYFEDGPNLLLSLRDEPFSRVSTAAKEKFGIHHCLALINKVPEGVEGFGFSSSFPDELQKAILLKELPLLRLFIKKFREENRFLLSLLEDNQIDVAELIGPTFYEKVVSPESAEKQELLKNLGIGAPCSPREIDVMKLLLKGYSASQIGKEIFLSKRTIEHHVERMKDKFGCDSKAELIQKARELECLGYFM